MELVTAVAAFYWKSSENL